MHKPLCTLALLALSALPTTFPVIAAEPHPFTVQDLLAMDRISEPQPSPKGDRVVFVVRTTDLEANRGRTDLWMVNADGSGLIRMTTDPAGDNNPRWAPDGKSVYFLSTRSGSSQVWRIPATGGDAVQVTNLPLDVANLTVSPDGSRLAFSLEVFVDCPTIACTKERLDQKEKTKASGLLYQGDAGFFRHWDTWSAGQRNHLFVMPVSGRRSGRPFARHERRRAFAAVRRRRGIHLLARWPDGGLHRPRRGPGGALVHGLRPLPGAGRRLAAPAEPDGRQPGLGHPARLLARRQDAGLPRHGAPGLRGRPLPHPAARRGHGPRAGAGRGVGPLAQRSPLLGRRPHPLRHGRPTSGQTPLFAIDVASGKVTKLVGDGHVREPKLAGDRIVFGRDTLRAPVELYTARRDGSGSDPDHPDQPGEGRGGPHGRARAVLLQGRQRRHGLRLAHQARRLPGGAEVPAGLPHPRRPQGSFSNEFHYRWNPQVYAGAGYAVVQIDFHGSTGYGQAFTDAIRMDWGGKPLVDLQKGLEAALARYPWIDGDRACALGASYGGFMINWIAGNWPDRFKCLVNHDGIFDQRMMYYGTEELWFPEWEQGGPYWQNPAGYEKHNPVLFVDRWKTPMLVVHGELDYRIPGDPGDRRLQHPPAARDPQPVPCLPGREPLGAQARQQRLVARDRARLAGPLAEAGHRLGGEVVFLLKAFSDIFRTTFRATFQTIGQPSGCPF